MRGREKILLLVVFLFPLLALSNASLWIDEANSALKAIQPSLTSWWQLLTTEKGSDLQMPLYMFYLWVWEKIAGHSELALRLANVPWLLVGHYSLYRLCQGRGTSPLPLLAIASVNPFLWFYLNEARPYVMQYAASCLVIAGLDEMLGSVRADKRSHGLELVLLGILVLASSSLLGMAWAASALLALLFLTFHVRHRLRLREAWWLVGIAIGLMALAAFYFWTLRYGARGSSIGQMDWRNLTYATFELFGFAGFGPGRLQIRQIGSLSFHEYLLPIGALTLVLGITLVYSLRIICDPIHRTRLIAASLYGLTAATATVVFGLVANFHLLGRHFTPLSPLIVILVALGVARMWDSKWRIIAAATWFLWLVSALSVRFAARHKNDDYRGAAGVAREAMVQNKSVWWAADAAGAKYYQLPLEQPHSAINLVVNPTSAKLQQLSPPNVVI
ncbi:MAG: hypothetical protein M3128_00425, partial [Verrucomicrobiota bacterium]|nr:hypothetical protein [Verrucomicrobiota bacterium]